MKNVTKDSPLVDRHASFAMLVWSMVDEKVQPVADKAGLDHGTIMKWLRRRTRQPEITKVAKFAHAYGLNLREVMDLITRDNVNEQQGRHVELPDLRGLTRGPAPRLAGRGRRAVVKGVALLMVMATTIWWGHADARPLPHGGTTLTTVRLIGTWILGFLCRMCLLDSMAALPIGINPTQRTAARDGRPPLGCCCAVA
jgi:transcriptional regulator with XRE-family HTH domain